MKYRALRVGTTVDYTQVFPLGGSATWKLDYPVGHYHAQHVGQQVKTYFFLNVGWRRTGNLFSHTRVTWVREWVAWVWYVDRRQQRRSQNGFRRATEWWRWLARPSQRRRRRSLSNVVTHRYRRRYRWGGLPGRSVGTSSQGGRWFRPGHLWLYRGPLQRAAAAAAAHPEGRWVWCILPNLFYAGLAPLMADLAYRLQGRGERRLRGVALPLLNLTRQLPGVTGAAVRCHGRFVRRQRADHQTYRWGTLHRTNLAVAVDQGFATAALRFGAVGVTLTVGFGSGQS